MVQYNQCSVRFTNYIIRLTSSCISLLPSSIFSLLAYLLKFICNTKINTAFPDHLRAYSVWLKKKKNCQHTHSQLRVDKGMLCLLRSALILSFLGSVFYIFVQLFWCCPCLIWPLSIVLMSVWCSLA